MTHIMTVTIPGLNAPARFYADSRLTLLQRLERLQLAHPGTTATFTTAERPITNKPLEYRQGVEGVA